MHRGLLVYPAFAAALALAAFSLRAASVACLCSRCLSSHNLCTSAFAATFAPIPPLLPPLLSLPLLSKLRLQPAFAGPALAHMAFTHRAFVLRLCLQPAFALRAASVAYLCCCLCSRCLCLRGLCSRCLCSQGCLCSLPLLLPGWQPDLGGLCDLVLGLARDVVWEQEQPCFRGLAEPCFRGLSDCTDLCKEAECTGTPSVLTGHGIVGNCTALQHPDYDASLARDVTVIGFGSMHVDAFDEELSLPGIGVDEVHGKFAG
eukprot:1153935-Pelagomonas_calceolata.AAC.3